MDDENKRHLDIVYKNCKNDPPSFLTTIVDYLRNATEFLESNDEHDILRIISNAVKDHQSQTKSNTTHAPDLHENNSCDLFDELDDIVPETQVANSEDSGESIAIPFYRNQQITCDSESTARKHTSGSDDDDSEYMEVHPESNPVIDEPQSQFLLANMDHGLILDMSSMMKQKSTDRLQSACDETVTELKSTNENRQKDDNSVHQWNDRSGSTTPDLDFLFDAGQGNSKGTDSINENSNSGEIQCNSESVFEQCTQQLQPNNSCKQTSTEDTFEKSTQQMPVFKLPAAGSGAPHAKNKSKRPFSDESVYDAATQMDQEDEDAFEAATQILPSQKRLNSHQTSRPDEQQVNDEHSEVSFPTAGTGAKSKRPISDASIYDAATQMDQEDEDAFEAATQILPSQKRLSIGKSTMNRLNSHQLSRQHEQHVNDNHGKVLFPAAGSGAKSKRHVSDANKQMDEEDEDAFEAATQVLPSHKRPSIGKSNMIQLNSHQTSRSDEQRVNDNRDLFEMETQIFEPPKPARQQSLRHEERDSNVFDEPTQSMAEVAEIADRRLPHVITQSSQPANTPPYSLAARVSNSAIEQFEKQQQAQREAAEKEQRQKMRRFFYTTSDEEDDVEDDDDLEYDLVKKHEPVSSVPIVQANESNDEETFINHLAHDAILQQNDKILPVKKRKVCDDSGEVVKPAKRATRQVSVIVSRGEVQRHMQKFDDEKKASKKPKKYTNAIIAKSAKSSQPVTLQKKLDANEHSPQLRQSKRTKMPNTIDSPPVREKKSRKEEQTKVDVSSKTRSKRNIAKNDKAHVNGKNVEAEAPVLCTMINSSIDSIKTLSERRHSNRHSARKLESRFAILFTKVNPVPYTNTIQNLGGYIVDTPQLGNVLICDKIARTYKFLYCLAKGIPIVTPNWLSQSAECGKFQPTDSYLIIDKNAEKRFEFSLKKSLETAQRSPLFTNYHIMATPNAQPTTDEICEIVECAGGKYANSASMKRKPKAKAVLITHKKDKKLWPDYRRYHPDVQIVSSEGFMQSIVQQKINFPKYELTD